ncbi:MAG: hypothetical protein ACRDZQ_13175, partial [Acidimicrobiales bacterium]
YDSCCRDARVQAAVVMAGQELDIPGGSYYASGDPAPLLVVEGTADTVNPPSVAAQLYGADPGPKYYLQLPGGDHVTPFAANGPDLAAVERVTTEFFRVELGGRTADAARILADGNLPGVATISSANLS